MQKEKVELDSDRAENSILNLEMKTLIISHCWVEKTWLVLYMLEFVFCQSFGKGLDEEMKTESYVIYIY